MSGDRDSKDTRGEHGYGQNLEELADALAQQCGVPVDRLDEFRQALALLSSSLVSKTKSLAEQGPIHKDNLNLTEEILQEYIKGLKSKGWFGKPAIIKGSSSSD